MDAWRWREKVRASYAVGFRAVNLASGLVPLEPRRIVPELVLERRGQHARHVLVEPTLKHRPEHVFDAILEALRTRLTARRRGVGLVISTVRPLSRILGLGLGLFARGPG